MDNLNAMEETTMKEDLVRASPAQPEDTEEPVTTPKPPPVSESCEEGNHESIQLEPVISQLISLVDLMLALLSAQSLTISQGNPAVLSTCKALTVAIRQMQVGLAALGVTPIPCKPGDPADWSRHQPVSVTPIHDNPALNDTVATVLQDGYQHPDGRLVRPASVILFKYEPISNE